METVRRPKGGTDNRRQVKHMEAIMGRENKISNISGYLAQISMKILFDSRRMRLVLLLII